MATHFGFSNIYILGLDHSYKEPTTKKGNNLISGGEINHFHPDYRKKGEIWHPPVLDRLEISYDNAYRYTADNGIHLFNVSRKTELTLIPRLDLDNVL